MGIIYWLEGLLWGISEWRCATVVGTPWAAAMWLFCLLLSKWYLNPVVLWSPHLWLRVSCSTPGGINQSLLSNTHSCYCNWLPERKEGSFQRNWKRQEQNNFNLKQKSKLSSVQVLQSTHHQLHLWGAPGLGQSLQFIYFGALGPHRLEAQWWVLEWMSEQTQVVSGEAWESPVLRNKGHKEGGLGWSQGPGVPLVLPLASYAASGEAVLCLGPYVSQL